MVVEIYRSAKGWSFAGSGPGVRVRLPKGSTWLPVVGLGDVLFVQIEPCIRVPWSAAQVAEAVADGRLKTVKARSKKACA